MEQGLSLDSSLNLQYFWIVFHMITHSGMRLGIVQSLVRRRNECQGTIKGIFLYFSVASVHESSIQTERCSGHKINRLNEKLFRMR